MRAMILAAGRGERLRPLTDSTPKPLLQVGPKRLIEYHIVNLHDAGITDIVINTAWLGEQIREYLGDGSRYGVTISYSTEPEGALETGGGIYQALPLLGEGPFVVINGDIWTDYPLSDLQLKAGTLAHLVLVDNPEHNPGGDFSLDDKLVRNGGPAALTFSGIGVYSARLFAGCEAGRFPLAPLLREAMQADAVTGEHYRGRWFDIGTEQRLQQLDADLG